VSWLLLFDVMPDTYAAAVPTFLKGAQVVVYQILINKQKIH
jgi:hypothetical protein